MTRRPVARHIMVGAVGCLLAASAVEFTGAPMSSAALVITPGVHIQVQGNPTCRSNSSSDLWKLYNLAVKPVGAFQIADAANKEMFVAASDNKVYHDYIDPATGAAVGWSSLGGPASGLYELGSVRNGTNYLGNQELYVKAKDSLVYHLFSTPGQGSGWQGWDSLGAPAAGIRDDIYEGTNYLKNQELYVLGRDGDVYHKFATPGMGTGWSDWDSMSHPDGVTITGDVQVGTNFLCNQEIFGTGTDGNTYHKYSTPGAGSGWSDWSSLGRPSAGVAGSVKAGENAVHNQELFIIDGQGVVYHDYATPGRGTGWSGWQSLGAPPDFMISREVIVDTYPVQTLTVTTTSGDYVNRETPGVNGGWSGWNPGSGTSPTA